MLRVPKKMQQYIDFEDGKIVANDLPAELKTDFKELKEQYEKMNGKDNLTDY